MRIPTHREPIHPGEMLKEEFFIPMEISQRDLANAIHVPYQRYCARAKFWVFCKITDTVRGLKPFFHLVQLIFDGMIPSDR